MQNLLHRYLKVTGIVAAVVLLDPDIAVMGFFLFVIPGFLLAASPTAFLWGAVFTGCRMLSVRLLGETWITMLVAAGVAALALTLITRPAQNAGRTLYQSSLLPETTPAKRIKVYGDVRIDLPEAFLGSDKPDGPANERGFACDKLCLALLFMPAVKTVTMNRSSGAMSKVVLGGADLDVNARTYMLQTATSCPQNGPHLRLRSGTGLFAARWKDKEALDAEWAARLKEVCVIYAENPNRQDILIRQGDSISSNWWSVWSLAPRGPAIKFFEIRDQNGRSLLRRFQSRVLAIGPLLYISFTGGLDTGDTHFAWGTEEITNRPGWYDLDRYKELDAHTDIVGRAKGAQPCPPGKPCY